MLQIIIHELVLSFIKLNKLKQRGLYRKLLKPITDFSLKHFTRLLFYRTKRELAKKLFLKSLISFDFVLIKNLLIINCLL